MKNAGYFFILKFNIYINKFVGWIKRSESTESSEGRR